MPRQASVHIPYKLSVGVTSHPYLLKILGLFSQESRPGRASGGSVNGISKTDFSDCSSASGTRTRYQIFDTRSDTEVKKRGAGREPGASSHAEESLSHI